MVTKEIDYQFEKGTIMKTLIDQVEKGKIMKTKKTDRNEQIF